MLVRKIALSAALGMSATLLVAGPNAAPANAEVAALPSVVNVSQGASLAVTSTAATKAAAKKGTSGKTAAQQAAWKKAKKARTAAVSRVKKGQYVRGRSGPNSFDCSGLMVYAYKKIGMSLSHSSRTLSTKGKKISKKKDLKVGDLVFYFSPVHHVAMYIGNGKIVHARNPSDDLEVSKLSEYPGFRWGRRIIKNR